MPSGKIAKGKRSEEEEAPDGNGLVHPDALVHEALTAISLLGSHQFGPKSTGQISEMPSEICLLPLLKKSQSMFKRHLTAGDACQTTEEEEQQGAPFFFTIIATAKTPK